MIRYIKLLLINIKQSCVKVIILKQLSPRFQSLKKVSRIYPCKSEANSHVPKNYIKKSPVKLQLTVIVCIKKSSVLTSTSTEIFLRSHFS